MSATIGYAPLCYLLLTFGCLLTSCDSIGEEGKAVRAAVPTGSTYAEAAALVANVATITVSSFDVSAETLLRSRILRIPRHSLVSQPLSEQLAAFLGDAEAA
jgi:hypothetical protein